MPLQLSNNFQELYEKLLLLDVCRSLPGKNAFDVGELTSDDLRILLGNASILATSLEAKEQILAYEIATRIIEVDSFDQRITVPAAEVILSRIGNFPGRNLLRMRHGSGREPLGEIPMALALECIAREVENTVMSYNTEEHVLTDFQFSLLTSLSKYSSVSVSAPTSAGKSFILGLDLIHRLKKNSLTSIVYLVPTRALIREVAHESRSHLRSAGLNKTLVRTVPFPVEQRSAPNGIVYVLTQERLMSLLYSTKGSTWISSLIVDEAQGIQDDSRGIILQNAVEAVIEKFPKAEVHFASPLAANPAYLQNAFNIKNGHSFIEQLSPVSQNLILVSSVESKPKQAKFQILLDQKNVDLGTCDIDFKLRGNAAKQCAAFARAVTNEEEATIIYADKADVAERLAEALIEDFNSKPVIDNETEQFIEFLKTEVHPDYPLIKCLPYGVAFHYGYMPSIVRSQVEDLFKKEKIQFVCCTSTLLQGVNLPAKHIIIRKPKRGQNTPMNRRDFLNLAGRAGRLTKEFHGNVWCLHPFGWAEESYKGEPLQEIKTAISEVMEDGGTTIQRLLDGDLDKNEIELAEAAFGKIFNDFIVEENNLLESRYATEQNHLVLQLTYEKCSAIKVTLPKDLLDANRAVRPDRLQDLYSYLKSSDDLPSLIPLKPMAHGSYARMEKIIEVIERCLGGIDTDTDKSYRFYQWLATQWIFNNPLNEIIIKRIAHIRKTDEKKSVSSIIREMLLALETQIRFRLVKHYTAYASILRLVLIEKGQVELADNIEPYHVYLECGAFDRVALSLMALGLSRFTALALRNKFSLDENATPEDYLTQLSKMDLSMLRIPKLCVAEIQDLLGTD